ncbi:MAG: TolC family protein [Hyphomicrobiales bacterium]
MSRLLLVGIGRRSRQLLLSGISSLSIILSPSLVKADDFTGILSQALDNSDALSAFEERERGAEAGVDEARAAFLPNLAARFSYGHRSQRAESGGLSSQSSAKNYSYGVTASIPLFRGGQHVHGLKSAKFSAKAAKLERFDKEQEISLEAVDAYLSVVRDRSISRLRSENLRILDGIRNGQEVRFRLGEGTRTDIALARVQVELTRAELSRARGQLHTSELTYERITGTSAMHLAAPVALHHLLPKTAAEVRDRAQSQNPKIKIAMALSDAARHAAKAKFGEALPSVDLTASYDWEHNLISGSDREENGYIGVSVSIPLFAPQTYAGIRKSRALSRQRDYEARDASIGVLYAADIAWGDYLTSKERLAALQSRKKAAQDAEYGTRREYDAGTKDVSDLLDARERVVRADIDLATAQYDRHYAAYVLLATIGELGPQDVAYLDE